MDSLLQDICYAVRQLRKNPGFAAIAVATLALGIGANTGMFTLVDAVLLKALPVPNADQLYLVRQRDRFAEQTRVSYPLYKRMAEAVPASASLAAMTLPSSFYLRIGTNSPEMTRGLLVSGNYFQTFRTFPALGRLLTAADNEGRDAHPVAVISYGCWRDRFAFDANVIGHDILINGLRFNVVGVAAPHFFGVQPGSAPDFWLPLMMQSSLHYSQHYSKSTAADVDKPWVLQDDIAWLELIVRATQPTQLGQISGALNQILSQRPEAEPAFARQSPQARLDSQIVLDPGGQGVKELQREFSRPLLVLTAMVGMVLLIACANLAGLLIARATARSREIAVRLSIGATRQRLVRQFLTESLIISIFGGLLGIAVAYWCDSALPRWASAGASPIPLNLTPDTRVLVFSIAVVLTTGIVLGLAPAVQATAVEPLAALKSTGGLALQANRPGSHWSLRHGLIVVQFVFSLVLLVGAGLFVRTLNNFAGVDPGFDRDHILTVWIDTNIRHYGHDQLLSFFHQVIDRANALSGVRSSSLATCGLATNCRSASDIYRPGQANLADTPQTNIVSPGYFENVGMPVLRGRDFALADNPQAPHVAIINETLARKVFVGNPIGQHFGFDPNTANEFEIVGVVADSRVNGVRENAPPMVYFPLFQDVTQVESLDVRAASDPAALIPQIRQLLASVDPDLPIGDVTTMSQQVSSNLSQQRLIARLTSIFGALALGLACLGIYGVMSFTVARRTSELGIRFALGASRSGVLWLVMRQSLALALIGVTGGLLLSVLTAHTIGSLLYGLSPYDPATIAAATALLLVVSIASALRPAWRAARIDPMVALRHE